MAHRLGMLEIAERDDVSKKHNFLILSELPGKIASFIRRNTDNKPEACQRPWVIVVVWFVCL